MKRGRGASEKGKGKVREPGERGRREEAGSKGEDGGM